MNIGAIVSGFFAAAFTIGALLWPFIMRKMMDMAKTPLRKMGAAMSALFATTMMAVFAVFSTAMLCGYINAAPSTFWYAFLGQVIPIGANLFFWFSRGVKHSS